MKRFLQPAITLALLMLAGCASMPPEAGVEFPSALQTTLAMARQGNAGAQFEVGRMHEQGRGYAQSYEEAFRWYHLAAGQGFAPAQFHLAGMYGSGRGVKHDYAKALEYHLKAARQGYADAYYPLGYTYEFGIGTEKDHAKALEWYLKCAESGNHFGMARMARAYERGELGLPVDVDKANMWQDKARAATAGQQ